MNFSNLRFYYFHFVKALIIFAAFFTGSVYAQNILPEFSDAKVVYQIESEALKHRILLSSPKRINNAMVIEEQKFVSGNKVSSLLELNLDSAEQAYQFYKNFFSKHGKILYQCKKRACGSSNYWADKLFNEHRLYGRDNGQYYLAGKIEYEGQTHWVSVYTVRNGLKQNLVFTVVVNDDALENEWQNGLLIDSETLPKDLSSIQQALQKNNKLALWVVAYSSNSIDSSIAELNRSLQTDAIRMQQKLIKNLGINAKRVQIKIVGPFHREKKVSDRHKWFRLFLLTP